jgi:drug/metabolite transporter (DMT)-like permease
MVSKHRTIRIIVALISLYLFWGGTYLAMKWALISFPPFLMAGFRHFTAGTILFTIALSRKESFPSKIQIINASWVGIFLLVGGNGLVSWAGRLVPSSISSLMIASTPIWMIVMNSFTGDKHKPSWIEMIALVLGMSGIALLVVQGQTNEPNSINMFGLMALLLASLLWAAGSLYSRQADMPKVSLYNIAFQALTGGVILLLISMFTQEMFRIDFYNLKLISVLAMGYLILFGSIVAYSAYIWLLKEVSPNLVSSYAFVNPVVAVFLGWALAGEKMSLQSLIAGSIIVIAVIMLNYRKRG